MRRFARRPRRSPGSAGGFTILEVMVALAILAFGLLAMLAIQVSAMRDSRYGRHTTQAAQIARDQMELLHRVDWTADARIQLQGWTALAPITSTVQTPGGPLIEQTFNLQWRVLVDPDPNLRHVDVRVTWNEPDAPPGSPLRRYAMSSIRHNDP